ncbi:MAG: methionyl-tRNA formyltransferase [Gammaproteobacteria bacterium]|jgi:methionyl-tRNA formyltransferase|nr:methionyl-tRNA formyltransferase [Gammaproteobacteria bacterium]
MKIVYAGTPEFAVPALKALCQRDALRPQLVLTQPDRPAGRGRHLQCSPVKLYARDEQLPVAQPQSLAEAQIQAQLQALAPDLIIVAAYGLLLPKAILQLPQHGCWNIHASLLPRWRGAAPIQYALASGDRHTGISIMRMEAGLDTGPVYLQRRIAISASDTSASLHDKLAELGADCLLQCIEALLQDKLGAPTPQDPDQASHAPRLQKNAALIDWQESAETIARKIRAYNPWPAAWTQLLGKRTVIWAAEAVTDSFGVPGSILEARHDCLLIACGSGALAVRLLQPAGSRVMPVSDWLNAYGRHLAIPVN